MGMSEPQSITDIVAAVQKLLQSEDGQEKVRALTRHYRRLAEDGPRARKLVQTVGRRPETPLYTSVSSVRADRIVLDVRKNGLSCGSLTIGPGKTRRFRAARHLNVGGQLPPGLDWADRRVASFLKDANPLGTGRMKREAAIQDAFLSLIGRTKGKKAKGPLARYQPVRLAGLPFQCPLPLTANGDLKISGRKSRTAADAGVPEKPRRTSGAAGHTDVLAHGPDGRLVVIEVKRRGAPDAGSALTQAVRYAAVLQELIRADDSMYTLLGYEKPRPSLKIDACVLLYDTPAIRARLETAADRLGREGPFRLGAFLYKWDERTLAISQRIQLSR